MLFMQWSGLWDKLPMSVQGRHSAVSWVQDQHDARSEDRTGLQPDLEDGASFLPPNKSPISSPWAEQ